MIRVGCCGFPTSMRRYFENFSLVELNSTFYQCPQEKTVEGWRKRAPEGFEFTVKAHHDISHKAKMKAEETSLHAFERMKRTCKTLNAKRARSLAQEDLRKTGLKKELIVPIL